MVFIALETTSLRLTTLKRSVSRRGRLLRPQWRKKRVMELQLPECPVCLQTYDSDQAIPRVLACGHTACEACIALLPQRFSDTIRCPACTQLVKYSHLQGPSALPKNIDLLRLCLSQDADYQKPHKRPITGHHEFLPRLWSDQFYSFWKEWVLPNDGVLVEPSGDEDFCDVVHGRIPPSSPSVVRWWMKENQNVSLVKIASLSFVNDSMFSFSYMGQIMDCLNSTKEEKRHELGLILRQCKTCGVYGLWYDLDDHCLYLVCERWGCGLLEKISELRNGVVGGNEDGLVNSAIEDEIFCFAMMGMEICKAIIGLHSEGLVSGCLAPSCFNFDGLGQVFVDLNEMLAMGRKIRRSLVESVSGRRRIDDKEMGIISSNLIKKEAYLSPEVFIELLQKEGIELECDSLSYSVGYGSDVWSLACVLLRLLIGNPFAELHMRSAKRHSGYLEVYADCRDEVRSLLETKLGTNFVALQRILCECLNFDLKNRPLVADVWKCIRELIIKPQFDFMVSREGSVNEHNNVHCLVLGELCQLPKEIIRGSLAVKTDESSRENVNHVGDDKDFIEGLSGSTVKSINLQGHLDSITGLAVGGTNALWCFYIFNMMLYQIFIFHTT